MANSLPGQPRAGIDYPRTLIEFGEFFPDDVACVAYLERLRWAEGFVCPKGHVAAAAWRSHRGLSVCPTCRRQVSATAGTIFEGTRKLRHWFLAAWEVTSQKYGTSALGIQRALGLGSYETAWAWLHKLRRAMVRPYAHGREGDAGFAAARRERNDTAVIPELPRGQRGLLVGPEADIRPRLRPRPRSAGKVQEADAGLSEPALERIVADGRRPIRTNASVPEHSGRIGKVEVRGRISDQDRASVESQVHDLGARRA